jgi:aquaporin Z
MVAQFIGALFAALVLLFLFPESKTLGSSLPAEGFEPYRAFVLELILTFFLMLVIINVSTGSKEIGTMAAIAIGAVILLEAMFAGPMTNASMNPIRSLAPALVSGNLQHIWLYLIAPFVGSFLAVISCAFVKDDNCC